jgi:nucleotide-binding universal stress UspA family protein
MYRIEKILVPVDLSACSRTALEHAVSLADELRASLDVMLVWQSPGTARVIDVPASAPSEAAKDLHAFVASAQQPTRATLSQRVTVGEPRQRILEEASAGGYDLIVIGTHGQTGRLRMIMGSIAEQVVRAAPCPVLTVCGSA